MKKHLIKLFLLSVIFAFIALPSNSASSQFEDFTATVFTQSVSDRDKGIDP